MRVNICCQISLKVDLGVGRRERETLQINSPWFLRSITPKGKLSKVVRPLRPDFSRGKGNSDRKIGPRLPKSACYLVFSSTFKNIFEGKNVSLSNRPIHQRWKISEDSDSASGNRNSSWHLFLAQSGREKMLNGTIAFNSDFREKQF